MHALSLLLLTSILSFGAVFTQLFFSRSPWYLRIALWFFSGTLVLSWVLFLTTLLVGYGGSQILTLTLSAGCVMYLGLMTWRQHRTLHWRTQVITALKKTVLSLKNHAAAVVIFLIWSVIFAQLAVTHNFLQQPSGLVSGGGAYGDLALHATFTQYFALQPSLDLDSPVYASEKTTYPFLLNFFAGQLLRTGMTLQQSLIVTSLPFMLIFVLFLWRAVRSAGGNTLAWSLAAAFFLLNGGVGIVHFFQDWQTAALPLWEFLLNQPLQYAHLADKNIHWSNILADYFLPQRSSVIGLGLASLFFATFFRAWHSKAARYHELLGVSILIGIIPFFHVHTYIALFPLLVWCVGWLWHARRISLREGLILIGIPVVLATPQLYWQFFHTFSESFVRFHLGWMSTQSSVLTFWLRNWGAGVLLWLISSLTLARSKKVTPQLVILFPLLVLFGITNIVIFQPHDYDNMKLMLFSYLAVCLISAIEIEKWKVQKKIGKAQVLLLAIAVTLTGAVSVVREMTLRWPIADNGAIAIAERLKSETDPTKIFLTADNHNHPVPMLAGRKVLLGYRGWLWTHGVEYQQVERDVAIIFEGRPRALELLASYQVGYVFISSLEREQFSVNTRFFDDTFEKIVIDQDTSVYKVE
jgi:hypothetical protein